MAKVKSFFATLKYILKMLLLATLVVCAWELGQAYIEFAAQNQIVIVPTSTQSS